jgi:hypothetical protein
VNSNVSITENQRLYGSDTFTYMVRSHGCYRPDEKVVLGENLYLSLHAFQDEGLEYNPIYAKEFCAGRVTPHPGYKPIDTVEHEYFQMLFCRTEKDTHPCYVHCCTTNERVYDFIDGDLLLSDLLRLVNVHARSYGGYYIDLNLLTCNRPCTNDPLIRSRILVEHNKYTGPRITKGHKKHRDTRKCTLMKRPNAVARLPLSTGRKTYYPMVGDRLWDKHMGQSITVTRENKGHLPRSSVFIGSIDVGSFVMHGMNGEDQVFAVEDLAQGRDDFLLIRNTMDRSIVFYVVPNEVTSYRVVNMEDDMDQWFEYY